MPFEHVLATSVPPNERPFAEQAFPGATLHEASLDPEITEAHPDTRILSVAYYDDLTPGLMGAFEALEAVVTRSDGHDHLPEAWLREQGIPGYHLGDYAVPAVTEYTVAAIIALLRRVPEARATLSGPEPRWERGHLMGRGLPEVTVGVLGVGRIGSSVVQALAPLGAELIGYDIEPDLALEDQVEGFSYVDSYRALLEESDVLTVHVPLKEDTEAMVDERSIEQLPDGACLVNTARGPVVDQGAVLRALRSGKLAGYAADVLPGEPEPPDLDVLQAIDEVWLTPHLAAYDERTVRARYDRAARIIRAVLDGKEDTVAELRVL